MTRSLPALLACALLLSSAVAGCNGSSTDPIDAPLFFAGEVAFMGSSKHDFAVASEGLLRFEMIRLQRKVAEGEPPAETGLSMGLGVGRPANDECISRYSVLIQEGGVAVLSLAEGNFCFRVFDTGTLFVDQVAEYQMSVSPG